MTTERPRFKSGYAGEFTYTHKGRKYAVQTHSMGTDFPWAAGVLEQKKALVGTVRNDNCDHHHEFPPDEICQFFAGYVPAKFDADYRVVYLDGIAPQVIPDPCCPGGVLSLWRKQCDQAWSAFSEELHTLIPMMPYWRYRQIREGVSWDNAMPSAEDYQTIRDAMAEAKAELASA